MLALDDESKSQFLLKSQKQCFLPSCVSVYLRTSALSISAPVTRLERVDVKERGRPGKLQLSPLKINVPSVERGGGIKCEFLPLEFMWEHPINNPLVISSPWAFAKVRWRLLPEVSHIKLPRLTHSEHEDKQFQLLLILELLLFCLSWII